MKISRIQAVFLIVATVLTLGFSIAGATGFRVLSMFSSKSWTHTAGPGVYPPPGVIYHK